MSTPPPIPDRFRSRLIFWLLLSIGMLIPGTFVVWRIGVSTKVDARLSALRKAGYPTSVQEVETKYYAKVNPASNAAPFFDAALAKLKMSNSIGDDFLSKFLATRTNLTAPLTLHETSNIIQLLADNREALELLHQTPPAATCRYPLDFRLGLGMPLPHLKKIQLAMRLLAVEAVWNSTQDRTAEAMDDVEAALRVTRSLNDEPILISQLLRIRGDVSIIASLERMLNQRVPTEAQLQQIMAELQKEENPRAIEHALAGELCTGIQYIKEPQNQSQALSSYFDVNDEDTAYRQKTSLGFGILKVSGLTARDFNFYLDTMTRYLAAGRVGFPQKLEEAQRIRSETDMAFSSAYRGLHLFSAVLLPAVANTYKNEASAVALLHNAQAALAIERYRLANQNQLPEKLTDLVPVFLPGVPMDPFNGEPLHFKRLAVGYTIYSVGPNRMDENGAKSSKQANPDDIAFTVAR